MIPDGLRWQVLERDEWHCRYCGRAVILQWHGAPPLLAATIDHVIPRSGGGKTCPENLVTCCRACNQEKGSAIPTPGLVSAIRRESRWLMTQAPKKLGVLA